MLSFYNCKLLQFITAYYILINQREMKHHIIIVILKL